MFANNPVPNGRVTERLPHNAKCRTLTEEGLSALNRNEMKYWIIDQSKSTEEVEIRKEDRNVQLFKGSKDFSVLISASLCGHVLVLIPKIIRIYINNAFNLSAFN